MLITLVSFVLSGAHNLLMLFVFIYVYWYPTRFPCQMMFVSFNSNTMGVTGGAGITNPSRAPESPSRFLVGFVLLDLKVSV